MKQGDKVVIGLSSIRLLKATVLMYLLPLFLLFSMALIAKLLFGEIASIVAGLLGLVFGLFLVKQYTQQKRIAEQFQPTLIRKIIHLDLA